MCLMSAAVDGAETINLRALSQSLSEQVLPMSKNTTAVVANVLDSSWDS